MNSSGSVCEVAIDFDDSSVGEVEAAISASTFPQFEQFSLLKRCRLRESNNTTLARRSGGAPVQNQPLQEYHGGNFKKFTLLKYVRLRESNRTTYC